MEAEEEREFTDRAFSAYGCPLEMVTFFQYMVHMTSAADKNWPVVVRNLSRARLVWKKMTRIIIREGAEQQVSDLFFKTMVQEVLLLGLDTWVVTPCMSRALGGSSTR